MAVAKTSASVPFVVSFGSEPYFLDKDLERGRHWPGRSVITIDGDGTTDTELVSVCETGSFDGGPRVVVVDEANKIKGDKALRAYIEEKDPKDDTTVLVAIIRSEKLSALWASAAKKGRVVEHKKLKTWDTNNEVIKWAEAEARKLDLTLDKGISDVLFQYLGGDLYRISSDLRKMLLLVGKGGKVTMDHVKLTISPSMSAEPFQVAEAAIAKDLKRAMNLLSVVYKTMGDGASVPVSFSLQRQVEKMVVARQLLDRGTSEEDMAQLLDMHAYRFKNFFLPHVKKHRLTDLIRHMDLLCRLDVDVKGPARSKRTHVELAVISIAG